MPVVMMHESFDATLRISIDKPKLFSQFSLIGKLQAIFLSIGDQVQPKPNPPDEALAVYEPGFFLCGDHVQALQFVRVGGFKLPPAKPERGVDITQTAG